MAEIVLTPWQGRLIAQFFHAKKSIKIICPFVKLGVISKICGVVSRSVQVETITRLKAGDFMSGASDLDATWSLSEHRDTKRNLRINNLVHAKLYIVDDSYAYIGSSNLTYSGLNRNMEMGLEISDIETVANLKAQFQMQWQASQAVSKSDFLNFAKQLQSSVEARPRDRVEHIYDTARKLDAFDLPVSSEERPPLQLADENDTPLLSEQALAAAEDEALLSDVDWEAWTKEVVGRVDRFIDIVQGRLGLDLATGAIYFASVALTSGSAERSLGAGIAVSKYGFDLADLSGHRNESLRNIGTPAFRSVFGFAALKSGLFGRYGRQGVSMLLHSVTADRAVGLKWAQNFLPVLVTAQKTETLRKRAYYDAALDLFGAIILTFGFNKLIDIVEEFFNPFDDIEHDIPNKIMFSNAKTALQEIVQSVLGAAPVYRDHSKVGPDNDPVWSCTLSVGKMPSFEGRGENRQTAERQAAERCLQHMGMIPGWKKSVEAYKERKLQALAGEGRILNGARIELDNRRRRILDAWLVGHNLAIDTELAFLAFIDRETAVKLNYPTDHRALALLGSSMAESFLARTWIEQNGLGANFREINSTALNEFGLDLGLKELHAELSLPEILGRSYISEVTQALLGAAAFDGDFDGAYQGFHPFLSLALSQAVTKTTDQKDIEGGRVASRFESNVNYTSRLQEYCASFKWEPPRYDYSQTGPMHDLTFSATAHANGKKAQGSGKKTKDARNRAAYELLKVLVSA